MNKLFMTAILAFGAVHADAMVLVEEDNARTIAGLHAAHDAAAHVVTTVAESIPAHLDGAMKIAEEDNARTIAGLHAAHDAAAHVISVALEKGSDHFNSATSLAVDAANATKVYAEGIAETIKHTQEVTDVVDAQDKQPGQDKASDSDAKEKKQEQIKEEKSSEQTFAQAAVAGATAFVLAHPTAALVGVAATTGTALYAFLQWRKVQHTVDRLEEDLAMMGWSV